MYIFTMAVRAYRHPDPTRLCPLGGIYEAATAPQTALSPLRRGRPMRLYPRYALVHLERGRGFYEDAHGRDAMIGPGDTLLVLPTLAHRYYPDADGWTETFIVFDGPVFRLWDSSGLLNDRLCLTSAEAGGPDRDRIHWVLAARDALEEVTRLQEVLGEMIAAHAEDDDAAGSGWLTEARHAIEARLTADRTILDAAAALGLSERAFRRRFRQAAGIGAKQFHDERRMAHACELMANSSMLDKQIADRLGYRDPLHFSRRFHQVVGSTPTEFRRGLYRGN